MKNTKIMLAAILTFLLTWLLIGVICWILLDIPLKDCLACPEMFFFMLILGWIPSLIVVLDLIDD